MTWPELSDPTEGNESGGNLPLLRTRSNSLGVPFSSGAPEAFQMVPPQPIYPYAISVHKSEAISRQIPPSAQDISELIPVFLDHIYHIASPMSVDRLHELLQLPKSHPEAPDPAVLYSVLAFACHFAKGVTAGYSTQQRAYISLTKDRLFTSDVQARRPRDYILAAVILARTLILTGDLREASYLSSGSVHVCMQMGFSQMFTISPGNSDPVYDLKRMEDLKLWLTVVALDLEVSLQNGNAPHIRNEELAYLTQLCTPRSNAPPVSCGDLLRIRASMLLHQVLVLRSAVYDGKLGSRSPTLITHFRQLSTALMRFRHSLPSISASFNQPPPLTFTFARSRGRSVSPPPSSQSSQTSSSSSTSSFSSQTPIQTACIHSITFAHAHVLGATMLLHAILAGMGSCYQEIACRAAKDLAQVVSSFEADDDDDMFGCSFGIMVTVAIRVLLAEMDIRDQLFNEGTVDSCMINLSHIDVLKCRLETLTKRCPSLQSRLIDIERRMTAL